MTGIAQAAHVLRSARRVFVLAGAGMGVASGLKTFRSDGGYWREMPVTQLATRAGFERDPEFVWTWYNERFAAQAEAEPNAGHRALAELEQLVPHLFIATQNVDGLQTRAGSRNLVTLHGDLQHVSCTGCEYREPLTAPFALDRIAHTCGGKLRPNVVWFGEALPADAWERAAAESAAADVTIVAGTSLAVQPAASLARAGDRSVTVIEINPDASGASNPIVLRAGAEHALPQLVNALRSARTEGRIGNGAARRVIEIAVALVSRSDGRTVLARKRGTTTFIQPGGKIEPGERPIDAVRREVAEELGLRLTAGELTFVGTFDGPAVNEPDCSVVAHAFCALTDVTVNAAAEIEELIWIDPAEPGDRPIAPLTRDRFLPLLAATRPARGAFEDV